MNRPFQLHERALRRRAIVATLAVSALALAACGDDDDGSDAASEATATESSTAAATEETAVTEETSAPTDVTSAPAEESSASSEASSASSEASSAPATGEPLKLMTIGPVDAPGFSLPSLPVGAQIAVDEFNAAGGVNGRPLELITCNDMNDPNIAAQCAQQAVDEGVVAIVGGLSLFDMNALPTLQAAGIPWVGLTTSAAFAEDGVFLIGGDGATAFSAIGASLAATGCENIAVILSANAAPTNGDQIAAGVESGGATVTDTLTAPATGADWAPTVEAARASGADCIASGAGPPETGPLIDAINAGEPIQMATADGGLPDVVLAQLGASADGVIATSGFLPSSSSDGIVQALGEKAKAAAPDAPFDQFSKTGYASVQIIAEAAKSLDEVTPADLTTAITQISGFDTGLGPVLDFTTPNSIPGYERVFNTKIYLYVAKDGAYELAQPDPIDVAAALEILSGQG